MNNENYFEKILDSDESIIEVFKPNRKRFVNLTILRNTFATLFTLLFPGIFIVVAIAASESNDFDIIFYIVPIIIAALIVFGYIFSIISRFTVYKNTYYCCTNKRIIIRRGFIGVDYQTLDYDLIGGMDVQVDFFDKIIKPNTGTISFISAASPAIQQGTMYFFAYIENPYESYKKIKEYCSKNKDGVINS